MGERTLSYLDPDHALTSGPCQTLLIAWRNRRSTIPAPAEWSGGGCVLLVEDENTVRVVAERARVRAGFTVTAARDPEAVEGVLRGSA